MRKFLKNKCPSIFKNPYYSFIQRRYQILDYLQRKLLIKFMLYKMQDNSHH